MTKIDLRTLRNRVFNSLRLKIQSLHHKTIEKLFTEYHNAEHSKVKLLKLQSKIEHINSEVKTIPKIKQVEKVKEMKKKVLHDIRDVVKVERKMKEKKEKKKKQEIEEDDDHEAFAEQGEQQADQMFEEHQGNISRLAERLLIFNHPADSDKCLEAVMVQPELRSSNENSQKILYYYLDNMNSIGKIKESISTIFADQTHAFNLSLSFGFVFEKLDDDGVFENQVIKNYNYIVFRPSNTKLFHGKDGSPLIRKRENLDRVLNNLTHEKLFKYIELQTPSSSHKIIGIYSMCVKVMLRDLRMGAKVEIPKHISQNQNFVNPETSNNMCFWTVVAYHETKNLRCIKKAKEIYERVMGTKPPADYEGINLMDGDEIRLFEEREQKGVSVFEMVENDDDDNDKQKYKLNLIRRPTVISADVINILNCQGHAVYISRLEVFERTKFSCELCGRCFPDTKDLRKHFTEYCSMEKEDVFPSEPVIYEPPRNIILQMNDEYETDVDFAYRPIIVYDFESMLVKNEKAISQNGHLRIQNKQQAISVSLCSNIDGYTEPYFIEHRDVKELFRLMFLRLDEMTERAVEVMRQQMKPLYDKVLEKFEKLQKKQSKKENYFSGQGVRALERYINEVPILGFNSGFYDINLNIEEFMMELEKRGGKKNIEAIKNGNNFKSLRAGKFAFLDVCQDLPPGYSLDKYIKAFNPKGLKKSIFPYEFLDSYDKLDYDVHQITRQDFFSKLKNSTVGDTEWEKFCENRLTLGWKTVRDLLEFYNNLDVKPFLEAVVNHREFFYSMGLDMFKDGMSLPGLAEKIMFSYEFQEFNNEFIHQSIPTTDFSPFTITTTKMKGYKKQDSDRRSFNQSLFIQNEEINALMVKQSCKCNYCWNNLTDEDWTLDRVDNNLGHNSGNCVLACNHCNVSRKKMSIKKFYRQKALIRYSENHNLIHLIDEANKEVFYKLKNSICGGPSIVFHRYHEKDKTCIKRPVYENGE